MKKKFKYIIIPLLSLLTLSCEENFSPKGELKDKVIFNCIIRGDTTAQTAFLSRSYQVEGYDPNTNTNDPAIKNAEIRLWNSDSVYLFKDGAFERSDTSRYSSLGSLYYCSYKPDFDEPLEIEALLANGKRLKASTKVPSRIEIDYNFNDNIAPTSNDVVIGAWKPVYEKREETPFYLPIFKIAYYKKENGIDIKHEKPIAVNYARKGDKYVPVYPSASSRKQCVYKLDAIERAMREISEGDPVKTNYRVLSIIVEVYAFDRNLSAFYSAGKIQSDGFTITIDQADYSNIDGGLGIFGSYIKFSFSISLSSQWVKSFGYRFGPYE